MISEEMNHKDNAQVFYVSPDVKVLKINAQAILCQSGGAYNDPFGGSEPI